MGAGREKKESQELFRASSAVKKGDHQTFIKNLIEKGYYIDSEETEKKQGLDGELVSETTITILRPPDLDLPSLKLEARETFGRYNYETGGFDEWDDPSFEVFAYKKPSHLKFEKSPWEMIDL